MRSSALRSGMKPSLRARMPERCHSTGTGLGTSFAATVELARMRQCCAFVRLQRPQRSDPLAGSCSAQAGCSAPVQPVRDLIKIRLILPKPLYLEILVSMRLPAAEPTLPTWRQSRTPAQKCAFAG